MFIQLANVRINPRYVVSYRPSFDNILDKFSIWLVSDEGGEHIKFDSREARDEDLKKLDDILMNIELTSINSSIKITRDL